MSDFDITDDPSGEQAAAEIPLPDLQQCQAWNAQDPLASIHHYDIMMYVVLASAFGIRMCFNCPWCNGDFTNLSTTNRYIGCTDLLGCNHRLIGGCAGIATGMVFANEFQGEGTPHGHGFIALANLYQHNSLQDIAKMIETNANGIEGKTLAETVKAFCSHVQRERHMDEKNTQRIWINWKGLFIQATMCPAIQKTYSCRYVPRAYIVRMHDAALGAMQAKKK